MTASMRVMSAGDGYRYLLKSVAAGDGDRALSTPLTRYYTQIGDPAGRWIGGGLPSLGDAAPAAIEEVTEEQLRLLIGEGRHPETGAALGRTYSVFSHDGSGGTDAVTGSDPLGAAADWITQRRDAVRAATALAQARRYSATDARPSAPTPGIGRGGLRR